MVECYAHYLLKKLKSRLPFADKASDREQMVRQIIELERRMDESDQSRCTDDCVTCSAELVGKKGL